MQTHLKRGFFCPSNLRLSIHLRWVQHVSDRVLMTAHLFLWKLYSADVLQRKLVFAAPDETTLSLFN